MYDCGSSDGERMGENTEGHSYKDKKDAVYWADRLGKNCGIELLHGACGCIGRQLFIAGQQVLWTQQATVKMVT